MRLICLFIFTSFLFSCTDQKIVAEKEVLSFLDVSVIKTKQSFLNNEIGFWAQKLASDTGNVVYKSKLSALHSSAFQLTGDINVLHTADSLLLRASNSLASKDPKILQALAQMAITRHRFSDASRFNEEAKDKSASGYVYSLLRFDADMELGKYREAEESLQSVSQQNSFHYLIRQAKHKDHQGDLDGAIKIMEEALKKIASSEKGSLYCWTLSNLGDMYGHAGRISDSYNAYLEVLRQDRSYLYALKGIAWIAYAHDGNVALARKLTGFIMQQNSSPDPYLFLAELAVFEGDKLQAGKFRDAFLLEATQPRYGSMYNKYLIELYSEDPEKVNEALRIAEREVEDRATPETFSWLAWAHYKNGDFTEAANIFQNHVALRTHEPEPLLKGVYILDKAGRSKESASLRAICMEAEYELGPVAMRELSVSH